MENYIQILSEIKVGDIIETRIPAKEIGYVRRKLERIIARGHCER